MSTPATEDEIAAELVAARKEGRSLTGFPGVVPATMAEAYRIQEHAMSLWPDTLIGWKIGYIPADRRAAGDPDRLIGPIWRGQFHLSEQHESAPRSASSRPGLRPWRPSSSFGWVRISPAPTGAVGPRRRPPTWSSNCW